MSECLAVTIAVLLACACTGNTGTLNLFPESVRGSGGASDGSPCANGACATGGIGSGGSPEASGGARNAADAAPPSGGARGAAACVTARDCRSGEASFCIAGRCVECGSDDDCTSGDGHWCSDNRCVECRSDDDCTPDKPGCVLSAGRCDDCSKDSQCEPGERCNVDEGKCR